MRTKSLSSCADAVVPTQSFEAISLGRGDNDPGVKVRPVMQGVTPAER
jgi:hypothetical protein